MLTEKSRPSIAKSDTGQTERDSDGDSKRVDREKTMAENRIAPPFAIEDATGQVLVDPGNTEPECVQKVVDRFDEHNDEESRTQLKLGSFSMTLPFSADEGTYGYQYEEWVLSPGQRMYVLGEASDSKGTLLLSEPEGKGHFIMSNKDEQQLLREAASSQKFLNIAGFVLGIAGLMVFVITMFQ